MKTETANGYGVQTIRSETAEGWKAEAVVTRIADKEQVAIVRSDRIFATDQEAQQHALDLAVGEAGALALDFRNPGGILIITG